MTSQEFRTVAITGATGYLGGVLRHHAERSGARVTALIRSPHEPTDREFRLDADPGIGLLKGVDLLIHCAYDMTVRDRGDIWRINVNGTRRLLDLAVGAGTSRVVVLSSMSAYEGTVQLYGQAKLQIERDAMAAGAVTVRPGLVYGPRAGGMVGTLRKLAVLPLVPLVAGGSGQFTVHEDDFAQAVWALASAPHTPVEPVGVANPVSVPFRHVLERLAWEQNATPKFVPVNWRLLRAALILAERIGLPLPVRSDSLLGLVRPASEVPNVETLAALGVYLRRYGQPVVPPGSNPAQAS